MSYDDWLCRKLFASKSDQLFSDPEFGKYLQEIATFHADRLAHEPARLSEEKSIVQEDTENLAFANYKTFIQAANCSKEIFDDFIHINRNVDSLLVALPRLDEECQKFTGEAAKIHSKRANNTSALQKHTQILEILEIPQVMDTCVRAGYYEEALELSQYASKLERRLGHIPIIKAIAEEIKNQRSLLLENLLEQLRTALNLSACLKVVAYLRRLNVFTDAELRIKFLLARSSWFENMLATIPKDNAYQHISKTMEVSRVHLFDIITQYRAVFPDEDPTFVLSSRGGSSAESVHLASIFNAWIMEKVDRFLETLATDLSVGVEGRVDSVLAQCMHFGLSLGRVGADFRPLAVEVFEKYVKKCFSQELQQAVDQLMKEIANNACFVTSVQHAPANQTPNDAPMSLLQFPCLAVFCNSMLTIFNNIRLCLPVTLAPFVVDQLQNNLTKIAEEMSTVITRPENVDKLDVLKKFCGIFVNDFLPFVNCCLDVLFPEKQVSEALGINSIEFHRMKTFGRIDQRQVVSSLKGFSVSIESSEDLADFPPPKVENALILSV